MLCGPAGSSARLVGTMLQPGGGGQLGGVMDGEWPGQGTCVFVTEAVRLSLQTRRKYMLEMMLTGVEMCSMSQSLSMNESVEPDLLFPLQRTQIHYQPLPFSSSHCLT